MPLYLSGGSQVYKKRFVANLQRVLTEAQFQKWQAAYASTIPDDVHVKLVKPLTNGVPCVDANDPNSRIITFYPFYFSLSFTFPLSKLFMEVCCTLELTVREFFYFFEERCFEKYAQVYSFPSFSRQWEGDVDDGPHVPITYCNVSDICKKLELELDMAKVGGALNIPSRFHEWHWLLSDYRKKVSGRPLPRMS
ncbi:unnamed protein product [Prunus armeniaca]